MVWLYWLPAADAMSIRFDRNTHRERERDRHTDTAYPKSEMTQYHRQLHERNVVTSKHVLCMVW